MKYFCMYKSIAKLMPCSEIEWSSTWQVPSVIVRRMLQ